jgi:hypothetical protein
VERRVCLNPSSFQNPQSICLTPKSSGRHAPLALRRILPINPQPFSFDLLKTPEESEMHRTKI